jgi:hypothetical protein
MPSRAPNDPDFRRLKYIRYADDFLLSFAGPKEEAEAIKDNLQRFLQDELKLELSSTKTLITHARTERARFLGYEIGTYHADDKLTNHRRSINGRIVLLVPRDVVTAKCAAYMARGEPIHQAQLLSESDYAIVNTFQLAYRGLVQYYILAQNIAALSKLHYTMQVALVKTLANKHKVSVPAIYRRHAARQITVTGTIKCLKVEVPREGKAPLVATFGGMPLRRKKAALLTDSIATRPGNWRSTDIVKRLLVLQR